MIHYAGNHRLRMTGNICTPGQLKLSHHAAVSLWLELHSHFYSCTGVKGGVLVSFFQVRHVLILYEVVLRPVFNFSTALIEASFFVYIFVGSTKTSSFTWTHIFITLKYCFLHFFFTKSRCLREHLVDNGIVTVETAQCLTVDRKMSIALPVFLDLRD